MKLKSKRSGLNGTPHSVKGLELARSRRPTAIVHCCIPWGPVPTIAPLLNGVGVTASVGVGDRVDVWVGGGMDVAVGAGVGEGVTISVGSGVGMGTDIAGAAGSRRWRQSVR